MDMVKASVSRVSHHHHHHVLLGLLMPTRAPGAQHWCPPKTLLSPLLLPRPFHHLPHPESPGLDLLPGAAQGAWSWPSTARGGPGWCPGMAGISQQVPPCGEGCWGLAEQLLLQDGEVGSEEPVLPQGRSSKSPCCFVPGDGNEGKEEMAIPVHVRDRHS